MSVISTAFRAFLGETLRERPYVNSGVLLEWGIDQRELSPTSVTAWKTDPHRAQECPVFGLYVGISGRLQCGRVLSGRALSPTVRKGLEHVHEVAAVGAPALETQLMIVR
jgi:hypothetical protein